METDHSHLVTRILREASADPSHAAAELLPLVYDELRRLAESRLAKTPPGQTLQATALVHDAFIRLVDREDPGWENRGHFFFAAARAMRDILVEQARRKSAVKRGGDMKRSDNGGCSDGTALLDQIAADPEVAALDLPALDEALGELEQEDPDAHRVVMLRFFCGLTELQVAEVLAVSERTVRREWQYARARLHQKLQERKAG